MRLCADIGGTTIDLAWFDADGAIVARARTATPGDWPEFVAAFADALARHPAAALSLATAGLVDPAGGRITSANVPAIHGRALADDLSAALGLPVTAINDADAFVLAEATRGAAMGQPWVFGIILGTGVGGALVVDRRIVTGPHGLAGEWGHGGVLRPAPGTGGAVPVFPCGCGRSGCLDTIGGARGIERLHRFLHGVDADSHAIAAADDPATQATADYWAQLLGGPLAMLLNTLPVAVVPVGGGLSGAPGLIARLDAVVRRELLRPTAGPVVVPGTLRGDAGLIGAWAAGQAPA
ncbi:ROK family protein [Sphingomonas sp. VNH70]|uniref:ROK family protein n=1 Tax=Sphingomonas silueang TaxID=3156617 RepID=UPI0032B3D7D9